MLLRLQDEQVRFQRDDDDIWVSEVSHPMFVEPLKIEIVAEHESDVLPYQNLLQTTLDTLRDQTDLIKDELYKYFCARKRESETVPNVWQDDFSGINNSVECWESLEDYNLFLDIQWAEVPRILLQASCDWQLDGGMRIEFGEHGLVQIGLA